MLIWHRDGIHKTYKKEIMEYISEILSFLLGLSTGWALKIIIDKSKNSTTIQGNKAGGDIAGRDIKK